MVTGLFIHQLYNQQFFILLRQDKLEELRIKLKEEGEKNNIDRIINNLLIESVDDTNIKAFQMLMQEFNANPNFHGFEGKTVLHTTCFRNNHQMIDMIMEAGAEINAVDNNGNTVIHDIGETSSNDNPYLIVHLKILLKYNPNLEIKNNKGKTPLMIYLDNNQSYRKEKIQCLNLLASHGAIIDPDSKKKANKLQDGLGEKLENLSAYNQAKNLYDQLLYLTTKKENGKSIIDELTLDVFSKVLKYLPTDKLASGTLIALTESAKNVHTQAFKKIPIETGFRQIMKNDQQASFAVRILSEAYEMSNTRGIS